MRTPKDVAEFMLNRIKNDGELYQEDVVDEIQSEWGEQFVYENDNGNLSIDKSVLSEFRNLTEAIVVWVRSDRYWRLREDDDEPGRQVDD